jgi:hypothetical protein
VFDVGRNLCNRESKNGQVEREERFTIQGLKGLNEEKGRVRCRDIICNIATISEYHV